ncbi:MAG: ABC transporter permease [Chlorobi bacterium]|nr:ABC transporter permease [Chlorobiota bacterium]
MKRLSAFRTRWPGLVLSFRLAWQSLRTNILRTFLSLLGVSVGIFTVAALYTGVESLEKNILNKLSRFGSHTLYIDRIDLRKAGNFDWAEIRKRRKPSYKEYLYLRKHLDPSLYKGMAFRTLRGMVPVSKGSRRTDADLVAATGEAQHVLSLELDRGRFFTPAEDARGMPVAVLGADVARVLFPSGGGVGEEIKLRGRKVKVVGILKKEGAAIRINPSDEKIFVPYTYARKTLGDPGKGYATIVLHPASPDVTDKLIADITVLLRRYRHIKPGQPEDFFVNSIDFFRDMIRKTTRVLALAGWILGGFSLLVGAFGIANIMFVTVKERTREIGIQRALGAPRRLIMWEFLFESVLLAMAGGLVGLAFLVLGIKLMEPVLSDFEWVISWKNILLIGLIILLIGIGAGYYPAKTASRMTPIDAIRKK